MSSHATTIFIAVATFTSLDYTLNNCMRESFYIPLPLGVKVPLKSFLSVLVPKLGVVASSLLILFLGSRAILIWASVMCVAILVWMISAVAVSKL